MQFLHSAILDQEQKVVINLQKRYYRDKMIEESLYLKKMREIEQIVEALHLSDLYR